MEPKESVPPKSANDLKQSSSSSHHHHHHPHGGGLHPSSPSHPNHPSNSTSTMMRRSRSAGRKERLLNSDRKIKTEMSNRRANPSSRNNNNCREERKQTPFDVLWFRW